MKNKPKSGNYIEALAEFAAWDQSITQICENMRSRGILTIKDGAREEVPAESMIEFLILISCCVNRGVKTWLELLNMSVADKLELAADFFDKKRIADCAIGN
jgi:hypothetical protein